MKTSTLIILTLVLVSSSWPLVANGAVEVGVDSRTSSIDSALTVEVTVRSTDTTPRQLAPIRVKVPPELLVGARRARVASSDSMLTSERDTEDLNPGGALVQSLRLPPLTFREALAPEVLFFRSDDLAFDSIVSYSESIAGHPTEIRQKHPLRVTGTLLGIAVGGFIGVMLAVLFTWAYAKSKNEPTPPWKQQLFIVLTGVLTATIVSLIRNADSSILKTLGIVVAIYDYRGGILIGLLFQPIAKKLSEWLIGAKPATAPPPAASDDDPAKREGA